MPRANSWTENYVGSPGHAPRCERSLEAVVVIVVPDNLYGVLRIPEEYRSVLLSTELQRLRDVRLLNTASPFMPALSDARRFTHTLGVTFLASLAAEKIHRMFGSTDAKTLILAALTHDVGSPPFGHLVEYQFKAMTGWTHERVVEHVLKGDYRPEDRYHQFYYSKHLCLGARIHSLGIEPSYVSDVVNGYGKLGPLIAGSLDLDNVDNVFRMAHYLGLRQDTSSAVDLAKSLNADSEGLTISESSLPLVQLWQELRRASYEILAFDESSLAGQAMLSEAISEAIQKEVITHDHWMWTDEELLRRLAAHRELKPSTRDAARRFAVGDFYSLIGLRWYAGPAGEVDWRRPENLRMLSDELSAQLGLPCTPYVFYDNGTFEKRLNLRVTDNPGGGSADVLNVGRTSQSTIVAVFTRRRLGTVPRRLAEGMTTILESIGFAGKALQAPPQKEFIYGLARQTELYS